MKKEWLFFTVFIQIVRERSELFFGKKKGVQEGFRVPIDDATLIDAIVLARRREVILFSILTKLFVAVEIFSVTIIR